MRIVMTGGVFGAPMESLALSAPENVLRRFFQEDGHEVLAYGAGSKPPRTVIGDVFHAHHFGVAAYYLAFASARPLVFTSHNPFLVSPYEVEESRLEVALQRHMLRTADAIVALAHVEADRLSTRFGIPLEKFVVIPNGLDLAHYEPSEHETGPSVELLAVGQLQDYKGHPYLLHAVADLVRLGHDVRLTIVSHRDDRQEAFMSLGRELGIAERISFEGPFATDELVERYRRCDIFVQPSLAECFPVTILEAMACGVPVVATDVGGVAEEVADAGIVVPARDPIALADAIARLCEHPEERHRLGRAGRARVEQNYDGRLVARRHIELYTKLVAKPRTRQTLRARRASLVLDLYTHRTGIARFVPERLRRLGAST
jgi:glycosyltransferase involved in cell wall biosynthesis